MVGPDAALDVHEVKMSPMCGDLVVIRCDGMTVAAGSSTLGPRDSVRPRFRSRAGGLTVFVPYPTLAGP